MVRAAYDLDALLESSFLEINRGPTLHPLTHAGHGNAITSTKHRSQRLCGLPTGSWRHTRHIKGDVLLSGIESSILGSD